MIGSRVCMSKSAFMVSITVTSWYEVYVRPHYCLSSTLTNVHADVVPVHLAFFYPLASAIICQLVCFTYIYWIIFLWNKKGVAFCARIFVSENANELVLKYGRVVA